MRQGLNPESIQNLGLGVRNWRSAELIRWGYRLSDVGLIGLRWFGIELGLNERQIGLITIVTVVNLCGSFISEWWAERRRAEYQNAHMMMLDELDRQAIG